MCAPTSNKDTEPESGSSSAGGLGLSSALETINVMSTAVDVLASIQSRLDPSERHSRTANLREVMRRATSVARAVSGLEARDSDREDPGIVIPTLNWPPDPPSYHDSLRADAERAGGSHGSASGIATSGTGSGGGGLGAGLAGAGAMSSGAGISGQSLCLSTGGGSWVPIGGDPGPHSMSAVKLEDRDRRANAMAILKLLCETPVLQSHLLQLLTARNAEGCTPFMQAVCSRAYPAAMVLLDTARRLATKSSAAPKPAATPSTSSAPSTPAPVSGTASSVNQDLIMSMLYPVGSSLDNSPLHILCYNDTCRLATT